MNLNPKVEVCLSPQLLNLYDISDKVVVVIDVSFIKVLFVVVVSVQLLVLVLRATQLLKSLSSRKKNPPVTAHFASAALAAPTCLCLHLPP